MSHPGNTKFEEMQEEIRQEQLDTEDKLVPTLNDSITQGFHEGITGNFGNITMDRFDEWGHYE